MSDTRRTLVRCKDVMFGEADRSLVKALIKHEGRMTPWHSLEAEVAEEEETEDEEEEEKISCESPLPRSA